MTTYSNALAVSQPTGARGAAAPALAALPRLLNAVTEVGSTPLTTQLFLFNVSNSPTKPIYFYKPDGSQGAPPRVEMLAAPGEARLYKAVLAAIAGDGLYSIVTGAQGPVAMQTEILPDGSNGEGSTPATPSADSLVVATYASSLLIPGVVLDEDVISIFRHPEP